MHGDLSDLITPHSPRRHGHRRPRRHLLTAYNRMRAADISQLPVMQGPGWSASSTTATSSMCWTPTTPAARARFQQPSAQRHGQRTRTLQVSETLDDLIPIFDRDRVAIVLDGDAFVGLITRVD
jgi:cystathionine beta-synthase